MKGGKPANSKKRVGPDERNLEGEPFPDRESNSAITSLIWLANFQPFPLPVYQLVTTINPGCRATFGHLPKLLKRSGQQPVVIIQKMQIPAPSNRCT